MWRVTKTLNEETINKPEAHTLMMNRYGLTLIIVLFTMILLTTNLVVMGYTINNTFIMQLNNNITQGLSKCGINPSTIYIVSSATTITNNAVVVKMASTAGNYTVELSIMAANNQLPIDEINITVTRDNVVLCNLTIPVSSASGLYNYTIEKNSYFIELISYSGSPPTIINSSTSLTTYGTMINSVIIVPEGTGNIICTTGSPSIPVYMVYIFGRPMLYIIQPSKPITSVLCRYSQSLNISYLLMSLLIGIAAALIYEVALIMIKINRLRIT